MAAATNQHFHLFSALPAEIRLKIWDVTMAPRIIEVHLIAINSPAITERPQDTDITDLSTVISRPILPAVFHVCQESRYKALSVYREAVGLNFKCPHSYPYNLFHPGLDTLYFPISLFELTNWEFAMLRAKDEFILAGLATEPQDVAHIQSLAIQGSYLALRPVEISDIKRLVEALEPFKSLKELVIVYRDHSRDNRVGSNLGKPQVSFLDHTKSQMRGRYFARLLADDVIRAKVVNEEFQKLEVTAGRRLPRMSVNIERLEG